MANQYKSHEASHEIYQLMGAKIIEVLEFKQRKRYVIHNIRCFVFKYFIKL